MEGILDEALEKAVMQLSRGGAGMNTELQDEEDNDG